MKKRIEELIVVEGRHDAMRLKEFFDCDTVETSGTGIREETLEMIRRAREKRGVIIFTDPDSPGNRIRNLINREVPGCLNAFVQKHEARTEKKVGVEHAAKEVLEEALANLVTYTDDPEEMITAEDMYELGLAGKENSGELRRRAGEALHIGFGSAKTMRKRLNCLKITKEELRKVIER